MSSGQLIIRKATLATRCEICHLSDQFDPVGEKCLRCESLSLPVQPSAPPAQKTFIEKISHLLGVSFLLASGSFICTIFTLPFASLPLSILFLCFAVVLTFSTLLLFLCYFCYWGVSTAAWATSAIAAWLRVNYFYLRDRIKRQTA